MAQRPDKLDHMLTPESKQTLPSAATGRSVSGFVLESALVRAEDTLVDRTRFVLNAEQWRAFLAALDAPPRDLPRLKRLFQEPSVIERGAPVSRDQGRDPDPGGRAS